MNLFEQLLELLLSWCGIQRIDTDISSKPNPQDGADLPDEETDIIPEPPVRTIPNTDPITSRFHWIIDPGHGPTTAGKQSPPLPEDGYVFREYEYNHDIAIRVSKGLEQYQISHSQTVHIHPSLGDSLKTRVENANSYKTNKPKRYVSIHANAAAADENGEVIWRPDIEGTETFIHPNHSPASRDMANCFQDKISKLLQSTNRGVKTANFHVLRETQMPACLIEVDFFTNPEFVRLSRTDKHRQAVADTIVGCILKLEAFSS